MTINRRDEGDLVVEVQFPQEERRLSCPTKSVLWTKINVVQKAAVCTMHNYGYELCFIRLIDNTEYVVMLLEQSVVMIDEDGNIDTHPNIKIRR